MIKLEHVVLPSPDQMDFIIEGMRNPMNSWDKSDSYKPCVNPDGFCEICDHVEEPCSIAYSDFFVGENDLKLMKKLSKAGTEHRKYMRMMPVYVRITAPLYWWKEFDTYKVGTVANSCSTMHKITDRDFVLEDFSHEHLGVTKANAISEFSLVLINDVKITLNGCRHRYLKAKTNDEKKYWWNQMIQLLPSSYNQTRNVMLNYEVLADIYRQRKNHKLDEWVNFCTWIEGLPHSEIITGGEKDE